MLDKNDYKDFQDLLEQNPNLKTKETEKIGEIILLGVEKNKLIEDLRFIGSGILQKFNYLIEKNKEQYFKTFKEKGLIEVLKIIQKESFENYQKEIKERELEEQKRLNEIENQKLKNNEAEQE